MNDRELLELAANASEYVVDGYVDDMIIHPSMEKAGGLVIRNDRGGHSSWNPLTDDGDALRLAVKLRIRVDFQGSTEATNRVCAGDVREWCKFYDGDMAQATRRAIVRAAAEIGKAMQ